MLTVPLVDYARAPVPVPTPSPFRCEASVKALTRASRFDCFDRRRRVFVRARSSRSQDISHIFIEKQKKRTTIFSFHSASLVEGARKVEHELGRPIIGAVR